MKIQGAWFSGLCEKDGAMCSKTIWGIVKGLILLKASLVNQVRYWGYCHKHGCLSGCLKCSCITTKPTHYGTLRVLSTTCRLFHWRYSPSGNCYCSYTLRERPGEPCNCSVFCWLSPSLFDKGNSKRIGRLWWQNLQVLKSVSCLHWMKSSAAISALITS